MALVNNDRKTILLKFVYCGAQNAGVTSTLASIHREVYGEEPDWNANKGAAKSIRGMMTRLLPQKKEAKTLAIPEEFFAIEVGNIQGFDTSVSLYGCSLPSDKNEILNRTRGADSVIFVADSSAEMQAGNMEALNMVKDSLESPELLRAVQFNKRDVLHALPSSNLKQHMGLSDDVHIAETIASESDGTVACFKEVLKRTLNCLL